MSKIFAVNPKLFITRVQKLKIDAITAHEFEGYRIIIGDQILSADQVIKFLEELQDIKANREQERKIFVGLNPDSPLLDDPE